ncbi:hypothetical protein PG996_012279 [Apiospora saccharicola]|uniref:Uncharacterized protein n=1 Tax=Apiospora saccharicola TaxID=335842 RepID=A0ABR1U245_9PEZI
MSHFPMALTLESAKVRREQILKVTKDECASRGYATKRTEKEVIPAVIDLSTTKTIVWILGLGETDDRRRAAMAGFISEDYVAWTIDACIWHKLQDDKCHEMTHIQAEFSEKFPAPQEYLPPWTNWVREAVEVEEISKSNKMRSLTAQSKLLKRKLSANGRKIGQLAKQMKSLQVESDRLKGEIHAKEARANELAKELDQGPATWFYP